MRAQNDLKQRIKPLIFRSGPRPRKIRRGPARGVTLMLDRRTDLQREFGLHESELHRYYRTLIRTDSTIYDVGAADGDTALMFARMAPLGQVIAFEPDADALSLCGRNVAYNPSLQDRVHVIQAFVSNEDDASTQTAMNHRVISIDGFVARGSTPPEFIKIDVDGGELAVLEGMAHTLETYHPRLLVEVHGIDREEDCLAFLYDHSYKPHVVSNAAWRVLYPELRPIGHNRWVVAVSKQDELTGSL